MAGLFISASQKSSGKTTVTLGLARAFKNRGMDVQTFKKGPDYIDPMWLTAATSRPCYNLDFHTMTNTEITDTYSGYAAPADICLLEGNKGLFDGVDLKGRDSNAAMARLVGLPVILVMDTRGMTRGIAPLVLGYQAFDAGIQIAGVILNQVGGPRHQQKLISALEHYTDIPVIGAIGRYPEMQICERHLGLQPVNEARDINARIDCSARIIEQDVDLDRLCELAKTTSVPVSTKPPSPRARQTDIRIAVAKDKAFGFYYPDDITAFQNAGAELVYFDSTADTHLPDADGLFIGGGFPEIHMQELQQNTSLRRDIFNKLSAGLPAYAECGGLMYLSKSLTWQNQSADMVGFIPGDTVMHDKPVGRGYVVIKDSGHNPWPGSGGQINAHEFHYASLENIPGDLDYAYDVIRGHGMDGHHDGLVLNNLVAGFIHQRSTQNNPWVRIFTDFVRRKKTSATSFNKA